MTKAKNHLSIGAQFTPQLLSIRQAAEKLTNILVDLSEVEEIFLRPTLITGQKSVLNIKLDNPNLGNNILDIARGILRAEWSEITQHEKINNPDIDYSRDEGYALLIKFEKEQEVLFWIGCRLGSNVFQSFSIRSFSSNTLFDYDWYERIFKKLVSSTKAETGNISLDTSSLGQLYNELRIKYIIGWITYFSNTCNYRIPDDIREVRYEHVTDGRYLYTSDEDFLADTEAYRAYKEKIVRIITEIKERVPDFSR